MNPDLSRLVDPTNRSPLRRMRSRPTEVADLGATSIVITEGATAWTPAANGPSWRM
ncbi:hypothetical protein [Vulcaniibacterium gelatinicum]|uniref:hypothetical protein n=1 Tax=Vulcaniibacterium gelatinicum TaxID=2598725 RepID=UPI0015F2DA26|nr:hypothetical protein [Vulcaniibacterium gelatinicum]